MTTQLALDFCTPPCVAMGLGPNAIARICGGTIDGHPGRWAWISRTGWDWADSAEAAWHAAGRSVPQALWYEEPTP